ncbi:polysaccharide biosynthesis/export family protein [Microvirga arabica]|uniref:Polysaccharide biosynthesis/export family protein n=1 Tax=Microvirga arabica TaxID=1128671 RepID=A0ABV6YDR1_9HYPH
MSFFDRYLRRQLPLAVAMVLIPTIVWGEYRLQPGDVLEISVTGIPELRQRSPVGFAGDVSVPMAGQIEVHGLSIAEARARITNALSKKIYQQRTTDGREMPQLILPDAVVVTAVDYRPVYLNGDVTKPGEQLFRPGMTVRHAVAVAGGYDLVQFRGNNPFFQASDLRGDYIALWAEYAREQARVWRLRTEIGEKGVEEPTGKALPVSATTFSQLLSVETQQLNARKIDREKERVHLQESIKNVNAQLGVLAEKKMRDEEAIKADTVEFEKVKELLQKGMAPTTRLSEARRALVASASQLLQTVVETNNMERQKGEYIKLLERQDTQMRIEALRELQDATLKLEQISARLQSTGEKLGYSSLLQSQLTQSKLEKPVIWVHRRGEEGPEQIRATEDTELMPGDVVDVALRAGQIPTAGTP